MQQKGAMLQQCLFILENKKLTVFQVEFSLFRGWQDRWAPVLYVERLNAGLWAAVPRVDPLSARPSGLIHQQRETQIRAHAQPAIHFHSLIPSAGAHQGPKSWLGSA